MEIEELLSHVTSGTKEVVLAQLHRETHVFYNCLTSYHFISAITRPTRITPNSSTLIRNISQIHGQN